MAKHKVQAYDVSEKAKNAIINQCNEEQRSESFIVSRVLNKIYDPLDNGTHFKCAECGMRLDNAIPGASVYYCSLHGPGL